MFFWQNQYTNISFIFTAIMSISDIRQWIKISLDEDTNQRYVYNDNTPGVYGLGESKEEALGLYWEVLKESITADFNSIYL